MKLRILFVDDEPQILEGLKRSLRIMREEWEMEFAQSGKEALEIFAKAPFDIIVSDTHMPGINGIQLLNEVMKLYPKTVRIILSGTADRDFIAKSVGSTHQYLMKPCTPEVLKATLKRTAGIRALLGNEKLTALVSRLHTLPSLPSLYLEVVEELQSPNASLKKAGEIISRDVGMTGKILQIVNSAFFGLPRHISNPVQAVSLLGLETIKTLVLSIHVFSQFEMTKAVLDVDELWRHSLATGNLAKLIAKTEKAEQKIIDEASLAGMLHDAGKLVLSMNMSEEYSEAVRRAKTMKIPVWEAEREVFGATHAAVGAYLFGLWGLPDPILEAVAFHHSPKESHTKSFSPVIAVYVANVFEHEKHDRDVKELEESVTQIDLDYLKELGLVERISSWRESCRIFLEEEVRGV